MTYQEFLGRVQRQAGLSTTEETESAVTATLAVLGECLAAGSIDGLPPEIQRMIPGELAGMFGGRQANAGAADRQSNPQLVGETRAESGGESTAESGQ